MFCKKRYIKCLPKSIRKHFFLIKLQDRLVTIKKRLWHKRFPVSFAKFLKTSILQNIFKHRSYLCENVYHMTFLVAVYLAKKSLLWCLLNKQKMCVSLIEVPETLGIYKKSYLSIKGRLQIILFKKVLFRRKPNLDFYLQLFSYLFAFILFTTKNKRILEW